MMKNLLLLLSAVILLVSCKFDYTDPGHTTINRTGDDFCYKVKVELTDRNDRGESLDIHNTRKIHIIYVHRKNFGTEIADVIDNIDLDQGDFKYYKCNKNRGGVPATWVTLASYIKRYKIISVEKEYF